MLSFKLHKHILYFISKTNITCTEYTVQYSAEYIQFDKHQKYFHWQKKCWLNFITIYYMYLDCDLRKIKMSAFIGDMTPEAGNETQTDESGLEREEIITETQEATVSSSQQTNELLRPNLRHRMLQKTGLSEPQPKDDTVEYPADDQYGLFEQVSYDTYDTNSVGLEQSSFYLYQKYHTMYKGDHQWMLRNFFSKHNRCGNK